MAVTEKPTIVWVPGAWHHTIHYASSIKALSELGYDSVPVQLKSYGGAPPITSFDPDVEEIRATIESLISANKNVVVVMHSYGGVVGSEALKTFLDRNDGLHGRGKVIRLVWLCSFVLSQGDTLTTAVGGVDPPWYLVHGDEVNPENPIDLFYNDLPHHEAEHWAKMLKPHAYRTFYSTLTVEPYRKIPSAYLVCEKDNALLPPWQDAMIAAAREKEPTAFDLVERVEASHSPFLSIPGKVAEFIAKAAQTSQ